MSALCSIAVDVDSIVYRFDESCLSQCARSHSVDVQLFAWLSQHDLAVAVELQDVLDVDHENGCTCLPRVSIWRERCSAEPNVSQVIHSDGCQIGAW